MLTIANVTITSEFAYYVALSTLSWYSPTLNLVFKSGGRGGGVYYSLLCTSAAWAWRLRGSVFCKPPRADLSEEAFFRQCAFSLVRFQLSRRVPLSSSILCLVARCCCHVENSSPFKFHYKSCGQVLVVLRQSTCCWKWLFQVRWEPCLPGAGAAANPYSQAV